MRKEKYITRNNQGYSFIELAIDEKDEVVGRYEIPFKPELLSMELQTKLKSLNEGDKIKVNHG